MKKETIVLATGVKELNDDIVIVAEDTDNYIFKQIHYKDILTDSEFDKFSICVISQRLDGEERFEKVISHLKHKNIRIILITDKEEVNDLKLCMKYSITDIILQPVRPSQIVDVIKNPKTYADVSYLFKDIGIDIDLNNNILRKKTKKKNILDLIIKDKHKKILVQEFKEETKEKEIRQSSKNKNEEDIDEVLRKYETGADPFDQLDEIKHESKTAKAKDKQENNEIIDFGEPEIIIDETQKNETLNKDIKIIKEYMLIKTKSIGVISLSTGAGSTFLTLNLAYALLDYNIKSSVIELPGKSDIYNILDDNASKSVHEEKLDYLSLTYRLDKNIEKIDNEYIYKKDKINFYINNNTELDNWSFNKTIQFYNLARNKNELDIFDIGSLDFEESSNYIITGLDTLFVVIDPQPYKLLNMNSIKRLIELNNIEKIYGIKINYIFNKWIDLLVKKDIEEFLNKKVLSLIPFIEPKLVFKAAYSSKVLYQYKEAKEILHDYFINIIKEIIPDKTIKPRKRKIFPW